MGEPYTNPVWVLIYIGSLLPALAVANGNQSKFEKYSAITYVSIYPIFLFAYVLIRFLIVPTKVTFHDEYRWMVYQVITRQFFPSVIISSVYLYDLRSKAILKQ